MNSSELNELNLVNKQFDLKYKIIIDLSVLLYSFMIQTNLDKFFYHYSF